jgi:DASS family divalent anion:Na+ symporter
MLKSQNSLVLFLFFLGTLMWNLQAPSGLTTIGWEVFTIFIITIAALILNPLPMGVITLVALAIALVTKVLSLKEALGGFSEPVVWLVVFAFFIAKTVVKTGLGTRIAYILISRFGKSPFGVAYSLIITEMILAPMIPSATSRGGGIIYPIAKASIESYGRPTVGQFFTMICLHSNIITSAMFLTAMAGNPVAQKLAANYGVELTWFNWAYAAFVPGLVSLLLLPYLMQIFCPLPKDLDNSIIVEKAKKGLKDLGKMTANETITAMTFIGLIILWIFEKQLGISPTTTALLGVCILLITKVLNWNDALHEKAAWDIFIWFAILVTVANSLTKEGVTAWGGLLVSELLEGKSALLAATLVCLGLFFGHYIFASVTVYFTALFGIFLQSFLSLGFNPLVAAYSLILVICLSSGFTHYGISSAPVFFSGGYFSVKEWWKKSFGITVGVGLIWLVASLVWWKIIDWI